MTLAHEVRAFGGGALAGENVTKFVHMDEAGISHSEPYCVQAAVIVDADREWKQLEQRLAGLIHELVPAEHVPGYIFHAKAVFHGTDPAFSRERLPNPADRADVVRQFAGITREFRLPIVMGWVQRSALPADFLNRPKKDVSADIHALAYLNCVSEVDEWMCRLTEWEVAMLLVENNNESKKMLKAIHSLLKLPVSARQIKFENIKPFRRIVEQPSFCEKEPLGLLQIADACAFSIARCLRKAPHWETLYEGVRAGVTSSWPAFWAGQSSP